MIKSEILIQVARRLRDTSMSLYSNELLTDGVNDGIDRVKQEIPMLTPMPYLPDDTSEVLYLPAEYHTMLGLYAVKKAFEMDERLYESQMAANEFEAKLATLKEGIEAGTIIIFDVNGDEVINTTNSFGSVQNVYYTNNQYNTTGDSKFSSNTTDDFNSTGDGETIQG